MNEEKAISAKHQRIQGMIDWIVEYMMDNGYPPCYQEIARGIARNDSTIRAWLREAKALKMIDYSQRPRSFQIPDVFYVDMREKIHNWTISNDS